MLVQGALVWGTAARLRASGVRRVRGGTCRAHQTSALPTNSGVAGLPADMVSTS